MKKVSFVLVLSLSLFYNQVLGQRQSLRDYGSMLGSWNDGIIQIDQETEIRGQVRYNNFENVVSIKIGDEIKSFIPRNIQSFQIESESGNRNFISTKLADNDKGSLDYYFFEVLIECKHFALLSNESSHATRQATGSMYVTSSSIPVTIQNETFYIFDDQDNIRPYMTIQKINKPSLTRTKKKTINPDLLKMYMGERYTQVKAYAKELRLSFKERNDLIQILKFYKTIEVS